MDTLLITIGVPQAIGIIFTITFSLMAIAWKAGGRLGRVESIAEHIKEGFDKVKIDFEKIKADLEDLRKRFGVVEDRVEALWQDELAPASSPRQLNERGAYILNESGVKQIIEDKKDLLLKIVKEQNPTNPYDAERLIQDVVKHLPEHCPEIIDDLKKGAFTVGEDIDSLLFVGSIYLRNLIFSDLGFTVEQLDKEGKKN